MKAEEAREIAAVVCEERLSSAWEKYGERILAKIEDAAKSGEYEITTSVEIKETDEIITNLKELGYTVNTMGMVGLKGSILTIGWK